MDPRELTRRLIGRRGAGQCAPGDHLKRFSGWFLNYTEQLPSTACHCIWMVSDVAPLKEVKQNEVKRKGSEI